MVQIADSPVHSVERRPPRNKPAGRPDEHPTGQQSTVGALQPKSADSERASAARGEASEGATRFGGLDGEGTRRACKTRVAADDRRGEQNHQDAPVVLGAAEAARM
ncbi:hypothetical protein AAVH_11452 [Aphelenchoides avenae]|nr:hypothetical protein AAVH_11452 [Aphelenchus avenae]